MLLQIKNFFVMFSALFRYPTLPLRESNSRKKKLVSNKILTSVSNVRAHLQSLSSSPHTTLATPSTPSFKGTDELRFLPCLFSLGNDGFINSSKAFIFSLKNLRGLASFKMDIKSDLWTKAAKQRSQSGPIFGETDLVIDSNPTASMESSTDLPNAYQFPSHIDLASDEQDNLLAGRKGFVVDDLETFYYECKIL